MILFCLLLSFVFFFLFLTSSKTHLATAKDTSDLKSQARVRHENISRCLSFTEEKIRFREREKPSDDFSFVITSCSCKSCVAFQLRDRLHNCVPNVHAGELRENVFFPALEALFLQFCIFFLLRRRLYVKSPPVAVKLNALTKE